MTDQGPDDRDNWVRITLRMPPELHAKFGQASPRLSLNGEIIDRLEKSFVSVPIPRDLRTSLNNASVMNKRSLDAEVAARLEASLQNDLAAATAAELRSDRHLEKLIRESIAEALEDLLPKKLGS